MLKNLPGFHLHASQFGHQCPGVQHQWGGGPVGCEFQQMGGLRDWTLEPSSNGNISDVQPDTTSSNYLFGPRHYPTYSRITPFSIYCSGGMHAGTRHRGQWRLPVPPSGDPADLPAWSRLRATKHTGKPEGSDFSRPLRDGHWRRTATSRSQAWQLPADWPGTT